MKAIHFENAESYEPEENWKRVSLCKEKDISVEHFVKPPNHASEGDAVFIPENETHIVKNMLDEPTIGIDIFVPGRSFDFWLKRK